MIKRIILPLFFIPIFSSASAISDSLVNEGWRYWNENNPTEAERVFLDAVQKDSKDIRGYIALSYLHSLQGNEVNSWTYYQKAIQHAPTPYPYFFAVWITEKFRQHPSPEEAGIIELLKSLTTDEHAADKLQANACEMLGNYYEKKGDLTESKKYYDKMAAILQWKLIGPFDNTSASGFDNIFPPETEFDEAQTYSGKNGVPAAWFNFKTIRNDRWIDFTRYFGTSNAVYYANTFVHSKERQRVHLRVGTSGSLKTFLNDELIIAVRDENNNDLDTYIAETELQQGWNRIVIKCGYSEITNCNFMLRITDLKGFPLKNISVNAASQHYTKLPGAPVLHIENFAEKYFKQRIEEHPDHVENYLLLADTYLRNDKAAEAEDIVRKFLKILPSCTVGYSQLIEVYMRGEKNSEAADIFEKIVALAPSTPSALIYQYYQFMANEDFDSAENILRRYQTLKPDGKELYSMLIDFYSKKKQVDKLIYYANEAYEKFPAEWQFANLRSTIVLQTERKYEPAIAVINDFLKRNYTVDGIYALSVMYLRANNVTEFEKVFNTLFQLMPPAPGFYLELAEVYVQLQQYTKAEAAARKALEIAPFNSTCLEKLGTILRMENKIEEAKEAFRKALLYQPTLYSARESLRELDAKPFIFSNFPANDVKSLLQKTPSPEDFPNDAALFLLDDTKRVVYPEGASEYAREIVVKVFNKRGVDYFKEYFIQYNSYVEALIIEKAVVIKPDGSETKADINANQVVFKSLEEGNFVHLKWRVKNYYSGKLSRHFWDEVNFNGFLPFAKIRYSLLVPREKQFSYSMQHSSLTPVIDTLPDGIRYTWSAADVPSLEYEKDMPGTNDIGAILHISSIPSWNYIVQWYSDLAKEKTHPSYEIREQIKELFNGKEHADENEKIRLIYNFITEKIRYSNVSFRQSAFVPQSARNVIVHKLGDCKDVATLCISMLGEIGIKAYHVLVNTRDEGYNADILPSIAFNHCIVGVETSEGMKYYDLTAYNYPAGSVPRSDQYAFALTIKQGEQKPFYLHQSMFMPRNIIRSQEIVINKDNSGSFKRAVTRSGSQAGAYRSSYRNMGKKDQEKKLLQSLSEDYSSVKLHSLEFEHLDGPEPTIATRYSFTVSNLATTTAGLTILKNLWTDRLLPDEALSYDKRNFAYYSYPGVDTVRETMTLIIEPGYKPTGLKPSTVITSIFGTYKLTYSFAKGVIKGTRELIRKKEIILPEEYAAYKDFYNKIVLEDERSIVLKK